MDVLGIIRKFFLLIIVLAAAVVAVAFTASGAESDAGKTEPLVIGMQMNYPPFEMRDAQGKPDGVSVELGKKLGQYLGRPVEFRDLAFDGLIPALKTGKIDLIISSMTATEDRARVIDFSEPYLSTGLTLLINMESEVHGIDDLEKSSDARVAVQRGTTGHVFAMEHFEPEQVRVLENESSAVLEVLQGRVDAFIYDQMSTYKNWQRHSEQTRAVLDPFQTEQWAIGIRKGNEELRGQVNAFLEEAREGGLFEELGDQYLAEQKTAFKEAGIPFYF